jgi:hypothetical protein
LYYLACSGVGHISCVFENEQGTEILLNNLRDLNNDISITNSMLNDILPGDSIDQQIVIGSAEYAANNLSCIDSSIPAAIAAYRGWNGYLQVLKPPFKIDKSIIPILQQVKDDNMGKIFSTCLLGAVTALEIIKLILNIGTPSVIPFRFDLFSMHFDSCDNTNTANASYSLEANDTGSKKLADYKALIVGTGGLGSPAAYALAKAGIGTIGLVDHDVVDISNLNRQILHSESRLGLSQSRFSRDIFTSA